MPNQSIAAPLGVQVSRCQWFHQPQHDRPEGVNETQAAEVLGWLKSAWRGLAGAKQRGFAHAGWSVGYRAKREDGRPWVTNTYVQRGAEVSAWMARKALEELCRVVGAVRDASGLLHLRDEALAGCYDFTQWLIAEGEMHKPAVSIPTSGPVLMMGALDGTEGRCRCPCWGHNNGDHNPSGLFNLRTGRLTCLATGRKFLLAQNGPDLTAQLINRERTPQAGIPTAHINRYRTDVDPRASGLLGAGDPGPRPAPASGVRLGKLRHRGRGGLRPLRTLRREWADVMRTPPKRDPDLAWGCILKDDHLDCPDILALLETPVAGGGTCGTSRVMFDLDGLEWAPTDWRGVLPEVERVVLGSPLFDAALSVVPTSCHGVQIVARITRHRRDTKGFYDDVDVHAELQRVGAELLALLGRGGRVDPSAWQTSRHARLPGPRLRKGVPEAAVAVGVLCEGRLCAI